jgi:hypothetical protein
MQTAILSVHCSKGTQFGIQKAITLLVLYSAQHFSVPTTSRAFYCMVYTGVIRSAHSYCWVGPGQGSRIQRSWLKELDNVWQQSTKHSRSPDVLPIIIGERESTKLSASFPPVFNIQMTLKLSLRKPPHYIGLKRSSAIYA